jgi:colicin import membrane protein
VSAKPAPHLQFAPPAAPGMGRAWVVAGVAHLALFLALGLATAWKTQPQTLQAEAELWSAVPKAAAPKLQEPPPPPPAPEPKPEPPAKTKPPKPAPEPEPDNSLRDAQIALEKKKLEDQKKKEAAERQRKALEKKKKELNAMSVLNDYISYLENQNHLINNQLIVAKHDKKHISKEINKIKKELDNLMETNS